MDEPTNHLDVKNVKWVMSYINSLKDTTVIMVSHDSSLLDNCCSYIIQIDKLKLKLHMGNLSEFVRITQKQSILNSKLPVNLVSNSHNHVS